jgi:sialate O-acetylesterase
VKTTYWMVTACVLVMGAMGVHDAAADVKVANIFGHDMVLQREKAVPVWGRGEPGSKVTVKFGGQEKSVVCGADGKWAVRLEAMPASKVARVMTVTDGGKTPESTVVLKNVVVGDVWLCSGDFGVWWEMFSVLDTKNELAKAKNPMIRVVKVAPHNSNVPLESIEGAWRECGAVSIEGFSALGYFFGAELQKELDVPVGLIDASYRYSHERAWMAPEGFRSVPELKVPRDKMDSWDPSTEKGKEAFGATIAAVEKWLPAAEKAYQEGKALPRQPRFPAPLPATDVNYLSNGELSLMYYGMICPVKPYAIRGVIWSIGESSALEVSKFRFYLKGLIEGWRKEWGQGDFPFYVEVLAAVGNEPDRSKPVPATDGWAVLRQEQAAVGTVVKNTGIAVSYDVSDYVADLRNRQDAGRRLALVALANEYGKKVEYSGPVFKEMKVEAGAAVLSFEHVGKGLMAGKKVGLAPVAEVAQLEGFAICGADKKWHWGAAKIVGATVVVSSPEVKEPWGVKYATFGNPAFCNLYNRDGLPAVPFAVDGERK